MAVVVLLAAIVGTALPTANTREAFTQRTPTSSRCGLSQSVLAGHLRARLQVVADRRSRGDDGRRCIRRNRVTHGPYYRMNDAPNGVALALGRTCRGQFRQSERSVCRWLLDQRQAGQLLRCLDTRAALPDTPDEVGLIRIRTNHHGPIGSERT